MPTITTFIIPIWLSKNSKSWIIVAFAAVQIILNANLSEAFATNVQFHQNLNTRWNHYHVQFDRYSRTKRKSRSVNYNSREVNYNVKNTSTTTIDLDTCIGKTDNYYPNYESNCTSYYSCAAGFQATYLCDPGLKFDGVKCTSGSVKCPQSSKSSTACSQSSDGYYADVGDQQRYFYCYQKAKVIELRCGDGKIYDESQQKCSSIVQAESHRRNLQMSNCGDRENGFYPDIESGCAKYYFCIDGVKTDLECQGGRVFNGDICVPKNSFKCPKI